jgi:DNA-binding transcriptional MerR regulator
MLKKEKQKDIYMKMSALIKASGESKSTILYYVKEGLLPKPRKHKANLHLYHQSSVDILNFIKLLKSRFNLSIEEIKQIISKIDFKNQNFVDRFKTIIEFEVGNISDELLFENDIILKCDISPKEMQTLIENNIITPINNKYTNNDVEIIRIYKQLSEIGISPNILNAYSNFSKKMAEAETDFIEEIKSLNLSESEKENILYDMTYKVKKQFLFHSLLNELNKN